MEFRTGDAAGIQEELEKGDITAAMGDAVPEKQDFFTGFDRVGAGRKGQRQGKEKKPDTPFFHIDPPWGLGLLILPDMIFSMVSL